MHFPLDLNSFTISDFKVSTQQIKIDAEHDLNLSIMNLTFISTVQKSMLKVINKHLTAPTPVY